MEIQPVITHHNEFTVIGYSIIIKNEEGPKKCPEFWNEWMSDMKGLKGMFGVCTDMDGKYFDYWIADMYFPWEEIPEGCETRVIPASLWAQFPCTLKTLQDTNTKIWSEWLPSLQGYELVDEYDIEVYLAPEPGSNEVRTFIWVPLKKA